MYEVLPAYALMLKRPPEWSLEHAPQINERKRAQTTSMATSLKNIFLACIQSIGKMPRSLAQPRQISDRP